MPTALLSAEIAVGVLFVLLVTFFAATYARRRVISRGAILFVPCGWRANRRNRWRLGHLRLGNTRLEWFSLLGISPRPQRGWDRVTVDLEAPRPVRRSDVIDFMPDAVPVPCTYNGGHFELALSPGAYTALRSWSEAAPPGSAANVA
ncbi:MAG: DUF2550 family protein [Lapillicoccus sp.]